MPFVYESYLILSLSIQLMDLSFLLLVRVLFCLTCFMFLMTDVSFVLDLTMQLVTSSLLAKLLVMIVVLFLILIVVMFKSMNESPDCY